MNNNKILMVLTNIERYETTKRPTGLWLGEAIHFYDEVVKAEFEVDFVSPKGGYVPIDPHSLKSYFLKDSDWHWYHEDNFKNKALARTLSPEQVNPFDYIAIYYTGGHGVMWDFPNNKPLQDIAMTIYDQGGYITSVCHGVVGLLNLKTKDNDYLIRNKTITGFANIEERLNGTYSKMPYLTETELKQRGAHYVRKHAFANFAVQDGRIITGQNPFSPRQVGQLLVQALTQGDYHESHHN